eukprot:TRINITY_DN7924_c0_g1_i1.p1 TRINITY_DN7924_c0_g1~~TRINITY_DN7924_c0_g1_i1.p1  ORF type:complete len:206 (-),score=103.68 TRINITY_DN7924_c0_g1_i1:10-627(-)
MSKKRGLSVDEKRDRLVELFHETKDVFTLKQLENIAPKSKGIVLQTVKEILTSLVDDGIVCTDKIGTGNYFWLFPSQDLVKKKTRHDDLTKEVKSLRKKAEELQETKESLSSGREDSKERAAKQARFLELENENDNLSKQISSYNEMDPEAFAEIQQQTKTALEAANRWTDNIFNLRSFCVRKWSIESKLFDSNFQVPEDFDYIE